MSGVGLIPNTWTEWVPGQTPAPSLMAFAMEPLTVLDTNRVTSLSYPPSGDVFMLILNGAAFTPADATPAFMLNGQAINWISGTFAINFGDTVTAIYTYLASQ